MKPAFDPKNWVKRLLAGDRLALARIITRIENRSSDVEEIVGLLYPHAGNAMVWGFTGPPGAGKSTLVDRVAAHLRKSGPRPRPPRVAVVAVDPSSPFSGGAILGDRIRMQEHAGDDGVYIRSLGTRGHHGGLSQATREVVLALDAAKFDIILIETVGVGQTELEILELADTTTVVLVPESGDSIQVMKAGLMEIADVFAVNKSDRPEADKMVRELVNLVALNQEISKDRWAIPIVQTQAISDQGTAELVAAIRTHENHLTGTGRKLRKQRENVIRETTQILLSRTEARLRNTLESGSLDPAIDEVLARRSNPYKLAQKLL